MTCMNIFLSLTKRSGSCLTRSILLINKDTFHMQETSLRRLPPLLERLQLLHRSP